MTLQLAAILSDLLRQAEAHPGIKATVHLGNGLIIDIKVETGEAAYTYLQIHRASVYPSRAEWSIVLKRWPYPVKIEPREIARDGHHYLIARWPSQPRLNLPGVDVCAQTREAE